MTETIRLVPNDDWSIPVAITDAGGVVDLSAATITAVITYDTGTINMTITPVSLVGGTFTMDKDDADTGVLPLGKLSGLVCKADTAGDIKTLFCLNALGVKCL